MFFFVIICCCRFPLARPDARRLVCCKLTIINHTEQQRNISHQLWASSAGGNVSIYERKIRFDIKDLKKKIMQNRLKP